MNIAVSYEFSNPNQKINKYENKLRTLEANQMETATQIKQIRAKLNFLKWKQSKGIPLVTVHKKIID